jgi:hypothetical protein
MSGWDDKILGSSSPGAPLLDRVHALFAQQRATWEEFRCGEASLESMKTKTLSLDGRSVIVQANPGRTISTGAKVDPASIAGRPCFLCPAALPPLERGIAFRDFILLPNPRPILKGHMTVPFKRHVPQLLEGRIGDFFALARALGPEMFVIYNGPRCGASAPDHLHFQAAPCAGVPLFGQLPAAASGNRITPLAIGGRTMLAGSFTDEERAQDGVRSAVAALGRINREPGEPMLNIVSLFRDSRYVTVIFPRTKHRSACYFAEPHKRILISPAAMEMAGIVVVADRGHFDRADEAVVLGMYKEVTLDAGLFSRLAEAFA